MANEQKIPDLSGLSPLDQLRISEGLKTQQPPQEQIPPQSPPSQSLVENPQPSQQEVLSVAPTTNPDSFIVRVQQPDGSYKQVLMTRQEVLDAGGEIPVNNMTWGQGAGAAWSNPNAITEQDITQAYKDLGLEPPDFSNAPRTVTNYYDGSDYTGNQDIKANMTGLAGYYDEEGGALYEHPSQFGSIGAALSYLNNIKDENARNDYKKAFQNYFGIEADKVVRDLPGLQQQIQSELGILDDKAFNDTVQRYKDNPNSDEFKTVEEGGNLTIEQVALLAKAAGVPFDAEQKFLDTHIKLDLPDFGIRPGYRFDEETGKYYRLENNGWRIEDSKRVEVSKDEATYHGTEWMTKKDYEELKKWVEDSGYSWDALEDSLRRGGMAMVQGQINQHLRYKAAEQEKLASKFDDYKISDEQGYDVNKISDALKNGDLQKDDVETFLGKEVYDNIQRYNESVNNNQKQYQELLRSSAESNNIIVGNVANLQTSDIVRLLKQGVSPELIIMAGNDIGLVQIAIAEINAEVKESQDAYNKLAPYGSQPEDSWKGVPYAFDMGDFDMGDGELSLARNTFTIEQLSKYLRDNPDDTETLKLAGIDQDTIKKAKDYADEISQGINTIQGYLNIDDDKFGSEGYAISNAISQANIKLPPIPYPYNPKTGLYEDKENQRVLSQKDLLKIHWDSLTDEQKEQVTQLFAKDPNKGSYFASANRMYQNIAEKGGIPAQVVLSPVLPITNVIAKKLTLDEAKEILKNTYSTELDALKDYIKDNGTVDISKLEGQFDFNPELKKQILEKTGYDDFDELKRNIEYYNDNIRLTPEELATAVGVGLADILSFGGAGALAGLGRAGVWAARTGWTAGGALFVPSAIKTITNPEAGIGEKILAGAAPVLMIIGAAGVKGLPKGAKAIEQPTTLARENTSALGRVSGELNTAIDSVTTTGKLPRALATVKALPDNVVNSVNDLLDNVVKFQDYVLKNIDKLQSGEILANIAKEVRVSAYKLKSLAGDTWRGTVDAVNNALDNVVKLQEMVLKSTDKLLSGEYKRLLLSELEKARVRLGGLVNRSWNNTVDAVNSAMDKVIDAQEALLRAIDKAASAEIQGNLAKALTKAYNDFKRVSANAWDSTVDSVNSAMDNLIKIQDYILKSTDNVLSGKTAQDIVRSINQSLYKMKSFTGKAWETTVNSVNSVLDNAVNAQETLLRTIDNVLSGEVGKSISREANIKMWQIRRVLRDIANGTVDNVNGALDYVIRAQESLLKTIDKISSMELDVIARRQLENLRQTIRDLKYRIEDFKYQVKAANNEYPIRQILFKLQKELDNVDVNDPMAGNKISSIESTLKNYMKSSTVKDALATSRDLLNKRFNAYMKSLKLGKVGVNKNLDIVKTDTGEIVDANTQPIPDEIKDIVNNSDDLESMLKKLDDLEQSSKTKDTYIDDLDATIKDIENELRKRDDSGIETTIDDIDNIKDGGGTATKTKTEIKPETKTKTAEELDDLFKTEEEIKPETKTTVKTSPATKTDIDITIMPLIESETELGIISYPFDPEMYPDAAREYERLLREQINVRGYTEEQVKSELEQRIEELSRTMTREQAIKQALDEMDSRSSVSMFDEPFLSTSTQTQPETKSEPFAGESALAFPEPEIATETETETQPVSEPMPRTEPLPEVEPIPETKTQPELETKIKESTKLGTVVLGKLKGEESQIYEAGRVKPGTIEWRQGVKWAVSPPPYDSIIYLDNPLPGTTKFAVGKGSAAKTLQVIGGAPKEDVDLDMGWAKIKIEAKNGKLNMDFSGGAEAANERWSMERESMGVSEKQSYDSLPSQPITTKIPRTKVPTMENVQEVQTYESEPISELVLPKIRRSTKLNSEQSQIYLPQRTYLGRRLRPTSLGSI